MNPTFIRNHPTLVSIILFLTIFIMILTLKPAFLFKPDGGLRPFGIGYRNKTIFPIWLLSIILGILCYVFVMYYLHHPRIF